MRIITDYNLTHSAPSKNSAARRESRLTRQRARKPCWPAYSGDREHRFDRPHDTVVTVSGRKEAGALLEPRMGISHRE